MAEILVLEDDVTFGSLLKDSLEDAGHSVKVCEDGSSTLQAFQARRYDLVVADLFVHKNGKSVADGGVTLISRIRRITGGHNPSFPIIAISGKTQKPGLGFSLSVAQSVGANAVLQKPFAPNALLEMIDELLDGRR